MEEYICPSCKQPIYETDVLLCHFCGGSLQRAGQGFLGRVRYSNRRVLWFYLIFFIVLAVTFYLVL